MPKEYPNRQKKKRLFYCEDCQVEFLVTTEPRRVDKYVQANGKKWLAFSNQYNCMVCGRRLLDIC